MWLGHHFQGQKVKVTSRSLGRFTHRGLNAWGRCSGDRENVLGVGNYRYVASAQRRARQERGGGIVSPLAQLVEDSNWLLPNGAADSARCTHTQHVSLNNACTRTVCKWFRINNGHLTLQIWTPCIYHVWRAMHEAVLKASSEARNSLWIKSHTGEDMRKISAGQSCPNF